MEISRRKYGSEAAQRAVLQFYCQKCANVMILSGSAPDQ